MPLRTKATPDSSEPLERDGKQIANLKCTGTSLSLLGPDWFEQAGVKTDDQVYDLPE